MGFALPRRLRFERWSLTPPFHPYRNPCEPRRYFLCGTFRRHASRHHLPRVSFQRIVKKLRGIAPCGVRTFLPRLTPEAILRLSKTASKILEHRHQNKLCRKRFIPGILELKTAPFNEYHRTMASGFRSTFAADASNPTEISICPTMP